MEALIVKALESSGPLTTPELAKRLNVEIGKVRRCCERLERVGRLRSELRSPPGKNTFFFPLTREVLSPESHERLTHINEAFSTAVRAFSLPLEGAGLVVALELLLERHVYVVGGGSSAKIESFAEELLRAAAVARNHGEVTQFFGFRPMRPPTRLWRLGPQLALI